MTTPRVKEKPLETPILAYLRQSTVNKQELSIENQYADIIRIIEREGFKLDEIVIFQEKRSAWERGNKKPRKEFTRMLKEIDKLKNPCILLARQSSRIARNMEDGMEIIYRIKGTHECKANIKKIIFSDGSVWHKDTKQSLIQDRFNDDFKYSEETSIGVTGSTSNLLKSGIYPFSGTAIPRGLARVPQRKGAILTQNHEMPLIIKAFEMRARGDTLKVIAEFLGLNDFKISYTNLTEQLFSQTLYIGTYTDDKTGEIFPNMKFTEGVTPIRLELWSKVQEQRGKKKSNYGDKQDPILGGILKTPNGKIISKYLTKNKYGKIYVNYQNQEESIRLSETALLESFLEFIKVVLDTKGDHIKRLLKEAYIEERTSIENNLLKYDIKVLNLSMDKIEFLMNSEKGNTIESQQLLNKLWGIYKGYILATEGEREDEYFFQQWKSEAFLEMYKVVLIAKDIQKVTMERSEDFIKARKMIISDLKNDRAKLEDGILKIGIDFALNKLPINDYNTIKTALGLRIQEIDEKMKNYTQDDETMVFIKKLPHIFLEIFGLYKSSLYKAKIGDKTDDIKTLIKLTTFELEVSKQKELKVKLFPVLDHMFLTGITSVVPPTRIELVTKP